MAIFSFKSSKYAPTVAEGLRDYFEELNVPEDLYSLILEAREAVEDAGKEIYNVPYIIDIRDLDLIGQGILLMEGCNYMAKNPHLLDLDSPLREVSWYGLKDRLASALIREGACWDCSESWNMDCYYFWSPETGQVSIHDPCQVVEWGEEARSGKGRVPQEWSGVPRQEYALEILKDREWRNMMAAATDIREGWLQRLPAIKFFYYEADEEGNLYPSDDEYEDTAAA